MRIPLPRQPLPDDLVALAGEYADGTRTPVEPRDAATVVLLRDGRGDEDGAAAGPEVYLLRRATSMRFAGGMCVFPGGGVDERDRDAVEVPWAGPTPGEWASRLGVPEEDARALVCAAVRETFEESGVLLAGADGDSVVADTTGEAWEADRAALESRTLALTDLLLRRGLVLRSDLLAPWDAWTTPVFEPRRYRTWFFVARLPEGQRTRDVSSESSSVVWMGAGAAVGAADAGDLAMMPPTYLNCLDVAQHPTAAAVLAAGAGRTPAMFTPSVLPADAGPRTLSLPEHLAPLLDRRRAGS